MAQPLKPTAQKSLIFRLNSLFRIFLNYETPLYTLDTCNVMPGGIGASVKLRATSLRCRLTSRFRPYNEFDEYRCSLGRWCRRLKTSDLPRLVTLLHGSAGLSVLGWVA
jgi:hypothetical protein